MTKPFTGRHMAAILVAFFGVVIAVNVTMATFATRTFGGTVVDNSYVASQAFNGWLRQARAQDQLGWRSQVALGPGRRLEVAVSSRGAPLEGAAVAAIARHPLGRSPDVALRLTETAAGRYVADRPVPAGRWRIHFHIRRGAEQVRLVETVA